MDLKNIKNQLNDNIDKVFKKLDVKYEDFGENIYCKCPIHESSDNPRAFSYSRNKQIWKCWTRDCQHDFGNDIFGFIRGALSTKTGDDVDFKTALKWACDLLNIKSTNDFKAKPEVTEDDLDKIIKIFNKHDCSRQQESVTIDCTLVKPSEYFISRGFKARTLKYFDVGDCQDKGKFKDRSIIPIHDPTGKHLIGAIGRSTKEYRSPKFLIYPTGFDKRNCFYNYHRAIKKAKETSCLFIMEGQGDVWKMYESGVHNAVSLFGKTLSEEHMEKLNKLAITTLVILMDNDQVGREARIKIQRQLGRMYKLIFPRLPNKDVGDMSVAKIKSEILHNLKGCY